MCIYLYIHIQLCTDIYIYIYIYTKTPKKLRPDLLLLALEPETARELSSGFRDEALGGLRFRV